MNFVLNKIKYIIKDNKNNNNIYRKDQGRFSLNYNGLVRFIHYFNITLQLFKTKC